MKKTLAIVITLALVLGMTAELPAAVAATTGYLMPTAVPHTSEVDLYQSGYPRPDNMVLVCGNGPLDSWAPYNGKLIFTVKVKTKKLVVGGGIPTGSIAIVKHEKRADGGVSLGAWLVLGIKNWADLRAKTRFLDGSQLPEEEPAGDGSASFVSPSPNTRFAYEKDMKALKKAVKSQVAQLEESLGEEMTIEELLTEASNRSVCRMTVGEKTFCQIVYGRDNIGHKTIYVSDCADSGWDWYKYKYIGDSIDDVLTWLQAGAKGAKK